MANPNPGSTVISLAPVVDIVHSNAGNFSGLMPDGAIITKPNRIEWAAGNDQGLIDPTTLGSTSPHKIVRIVLFMTGQTTWKIELLDGTSAGQLASGTTDAFVQILNAGFLFDGQQLRVTTTGGGTSSVKFICTLANVADKLGL